MALINLFKNEMFKSNQKFRSSIVRALRLSDTTNIHIDSVLECLINRLREDHYVIVRRSCLESLNSIVGKNIELNNNIT